MYEHEDLVHESFPKPADKPTPAHLAGDLVPLPVSPSEGIAKPGAYGLYSIKKDPSSDQSNVSGVITPQGVVKKPK